MTLKQRIQSDFVQAFKNKDEAKKRALSSLKAEITKTEKAMRLTELDDQGTLKVISSAIKQIKNAMAEFEKGNRQDLVTSYGEELEVIQSYMPAQMTIEEINAEVGRLFTEQNLGENPKKAFGSIMSHFSKNFQGRYDAQALKVVAEAYAVTAQR